MIGRSLKPGTEGVLEEGVEEAVNSLTTFMSFKPISKESVLFVMSHGSSANTIVDINGQDVLVEEEIIKEFDNKRCPQLIGKL